MPTVIHDEKGNRELKSYDAFMLWLGDVKLRFAQCIEAGENPYLCGAPKEVAFVETIFGNATDEEKGFIFNELLLDYIKRLRELAFAHKDKQTIRTMRREYLTPVSSGGSNDSQTEKE